MAGESMNGSWREEMEDLRGSERTGYMHQDVIKVPSLSIASSIGERQILKEEKMVAVEKLKRHKKDSEY